MYGRLFSAMQVSLIAVVNHLFFSCLASFPIVVAVNNEREAALTSKLFKSYNSLIRPARNPEDRTRICFGMQLVQLINVDERNQVMKSNVWLRMRWVDYQLAWNPKEYDNITVVRMASERIWNPDIVLFNNADGRYEVSYKARALLYSEGESLSQVFFLPPSIFKSYCKIDVKYFPFDQQECEMKFGSWTFNAEQVELEFDGGFPYVDLSDYVMSGTWDVVDCPGYHRLIIGRNGEPNRTRIDFKIVIRRKTLFYTVNLIIPVFLISFLTICVFYLPAAAQEKVTLSISVLLALVVFLLLIQKILPPSSSTIPLIALYLLFTFLLNMISVVVAVVIINWSFRCPSTHTMPRWVRAVFLQALPRFLWMKHPSHDEDVLFSKKEKLLRNKYEEERQEFIGESESLLGKPKANKRGELMLNIRNRRKAARLTKEIYKSVRSIRYIAHSFKMESESGNVAQDWAFVGLVIDRVLLVVFSLVTIGGTIGIFILSPYIFDVVDQQQIIERINHIKEESSKIRVNSCFE